MPYLRNSIRRRALLFILLFGVQVGFMLHFGLIAEQCRTPNYNFCPETETLATEYQQYEGRTLTLTGTVVMTEPLVIALSYHNGVLRVEVQSVERKVTRGSRLGVYGTLRPDHVIQAQDVIVHPATNRRVMFTVSVLAILLTAALGLYQWTFNRTQLVFHGRGES